MLLEIEHRPIRPEAIENIIAFPHPDTVGAQGNSCPHLPDCWRTFVNAHAPALARQHHTEAQTADTTPHNLCMFRHQQLRRSEPWTRNQDAIAWFECVVQVQIK